jgi:disulfide bond formation protein DsbB
MAAQGEGGRMTVEPQSETEKPSVSPVEVLLTPFTWVDRALARHGLYLALITAWVAMLGSLYFSEIRNFDPCVLCWYQRVLLYPLTLIIAIGILRRDPKVHTYILPLALICIPMSTYHQLLQRTSWFSEKSVCRHGTPCSALYINWLGFIDIPTLALFAALIITLATSAWARGGPPDPVPGQRRPWLPVLGCIAAVSVVFVVLFRTVG